MKATQKHCKSLGTSKQILERNLLTQNYALLSNIEQMQSLESYKEGMQRIKEKHVS